MSFFKSLKKRVRIDRVGAVELKHFEQARRQEVETQQREQLKKEALIWETIYPCLTKILGELLDSRKIVPDSLVIV